MTDLIEISCFTDYFQRILCNIIEHVRKNWKLVEDRGNDVGRLLCLLGKKRLVHQHIVEQTGI